MRGKGRRRGGECGPESRKLQEKRKGDGVGMERAEREKNWPRPRRRLRGVGEVRGSEYGDPWGPVGEDAWLPGRNRATIGGVEGDDLNEVRGELLTKT